MNNHNIESEIELAKQYVKNWPLRLKELYARGIKIMEGVKTIEREWEWIQIEMFGRELEEGEILEGLPHPKKRVDKAAVKKRLEEFRTEWEAMKNGDYDDEVRNAIADEIKSGQTKYLQLQLMLFEWETKDKELEKSDSLSPNIQQGLNWYPSVLIYGIPGSGKTTFVESEVTRRLALGHKVIVLDPHAAYGAWSGCEIVGGGMNYEAINEKLNWFATEVVRRYEKIHSEPNPQFTPLTLVCDEFTNWAIRCKSSGNFFCTAVSDIRKAECFVIIISHTRTLTGLGDAKGMAALRDEALLEVEILGHLDETTGRATPRFEANVKFPGQSLRNRTLIKLPKKPELLMLK